LIRVRSLIIFGFSLQPKALNLTDFSGFRIGLKHKSLQFVSGFRLGLKHKPLRLQKSTHFRVEPAEFESSYSVTKFSLVSAKFESLHSSFGV